MAVQVAQIGDIPAWLRLTAEVEALFGPMLSDPGYLATVQRKISARRAFCVRAPAFPDCPGTELAGGLLFSAHPPLYAIAWLAVSARYRRDGFGRRLVEHALALCQPPCEVRVITFAPGYPGGEPARCFYTALGFLPFNLARGPDGQLTRQEFRLTL